MVKVKVLEDFSLSKFNDVENLIRASAKNTEGYLYKNDIFECNKELAEYLTKDNRLGRAFVEIIEIIPETTAGLLQIEEIEEPIKEITKPKKTKTKKTIAKK